MAETFYLLIAGSRDFGAYDRFEFSNEILTTETICEVICNAMLAKQIEMGRNICIVHGDARGADTVGKLYGNRHGYEVMAFPAKWDMYGKSAGYIRNSEMYDFLKGKEYKGALLFWDGMSRGTRNNFLQACKRGIDIKCFNYLAQRFLTQDEIQEIYQDCLYENRSYS